MVGIMSAVVVHYQVQFQLRSVLGIDLTQGAQVGVATLLSVQLGQTVERCRDVGMVGTERFFPNLQSTLRQRHRFGEFIGSV
jgi:hypothetical protein